MPGSFRIGKIAGIDIDINVSWIIILVLLTVSLATGWFPQLYPGWSTATYWLTAFLSSLLLFVSVLLHELAHSLVARRRDLPVIGSTSCLLLRGKCSFQGQESLQDMSAPSPAD